MHTFQLLFPFYLSFLQIVQISSALTRREFQGVSLKGGESSMSHSRHPLGREKDFFASPPLLLRNEKNRLLLPPCCLCVHVRTYVYVFLSPLSSYGR